MVRRTRAWGAGVLLGLVLLVPGQLDAAATTSPVGAPPASGVTVDAVPVFGADHDPGESVAVAVTVQAAELIDGSLTIENPSDGTTVSQALEVAGASAKRAVLVVPTVAYNDAQLLVQVTDHGTVVGSAKLRLTHDVTTTVVGVMPGVAARSGEPPAKTNLGADLGDAVLKPFDGSILDAGPAAIEQLDTVVADASDLTSLTPARRAALFSWIADGGTLVVDDDPGDALPTEWRIGAAGYVFAGAGEIRRSDGLAAQGKWKQVVPPAALAAVDFQNSTMEFGLPATISLARRAGVTVPALGSVLIVLAAYVVVVGPLLYLVLRRLGRLTLAWIAVPALALLVAGGVVVAGHSWRNSGGPAAASFVTTNPVGSSVRSELLLFSRDGGDVGVPVPAGWAIVGANGFNEGVGDGTRKSLTLGPGAARIGSRLESGQVVLLRTSGLAADRGFEVTVRATGETTLAGTVTNRTSGELHDIAVFSAGTAASIGTLRAGESKPFTLSDVSPVNAGRNGPPSMSVWNDPEVGFGGPFQQASAASPVDLGLWSDMSFRLPGGLYPPGGLRVAGWTDDRPSELGADVAARSVITSVTPISAGGSPLRAVSVRQRLVSMPTGGFNPGSKVTWRYAIPPDVSPGPATLSGLVGYDKVEVLTAAGWTKLTKRADGSATVTADQFDHGALLVRATLNVNGFGFDPSQTPSLTGGAS